jgi:hypothetical protein
MNLRASEILVDCGAMPAGSAAGGPAASPLTPPGLSFPGSDVNLITGTETYPHVTQSESFVWSHGSTIVAAYNDSRGFTESPAILLGVSVSHDGGATFTRLGPPSPFTGHGSARSDPIVVYNEKLGKWFVGNLAGGAGAVECGGQGIGLWTSTDADTWTVGACAHVGSNDDRESMWVDNNPSSPFYGRMYVSFNDFSAGSPAGALKVTHSDDGTTWTAPVTLFSSFRRNVQLTGSPGSDGTVFSVGQNESGGGVGNTGQQNYMYRSTDGGVTWTSTTMGPTFTIAGSQSCGYFPAIPPIWRQTGWGQPAVGPGGVVHYVYAAHGTGSDEADIFYVRSTDNGATWSAPLRLNTDSSGKAQWMPSLRVTPGGVVEATWYDRRSTTNGTNYQRFARISKDNGATWGTDEALSTVLIPQPTQPDPNIQACYAGDYNYTTANETTGFDAWTDGRVSIEPAGPVQKVFFHSVALVTTPPTATTQPASNVTGGEATLHGRVNPNGANTSYQFEYGKTTAYGTSVPVPAEAIGSGVIDVEVSQTIAGLEPGTAYHFRAAATSVVGTTYGGDQTFTTLPASTLCKAHAGGESCAPEDRYPANTALKASSSSLTIENNLSDVTCSGSTIEGQTTAASGAPLGASISSWALSGCKSGAASCTTTKTRNLPYTASIEASGAGNGTIAVEDSVGIGWRLACGTAIDCEFLVNALDLEAGGGSPATLKTTDTALSRTGIHCPSTATLKAGSSHEVSTPKPLFVLRS